MDSTSDSDSEIEDFSTPNNKSTTIRSCPCGSTDHMTILSKNCKFHDVLNLKKNKSGFYCAARKEFFSNDYVIESSNLHYRHSVGEMTFSCYNCKALLFRGEKTNTIKKPCSNMCCEDGKIILPEKSIPSPLICSLLQGKDSISQDFKNNIRAYNSSLSFTSLGVHLDQRFANNKCGHYTFRIHGQVHHRIGSLLPKENTTPTFMQIYFSDINNELDNRLKNFPSLNRLLLLEL